MKSLVVIPDIHFPYEDKRAVKTLLQFCKDVKPTRAVQLGDAYDCYNLTTFPKRYGVGGPMLAEANAGKAFWEELIASCGQVDYLPGNHEERIQKRLEELVPSLIGHPALELSNLLLLPKKVRVHPYHTRLRVGNMIITHGDNLKGTKAMHAAANVLKHYGNQHTVFGHLHRIEYAAKVQYNYDRTREYTARTIGWLGNEKARAFEYATDPGWQHGFLYVEFFGEDRFSAYQITLVDGKFMFKGKLYG
jgi:predicted phosphodiesterase